MVNPFGMDERCTNCPALVEERSHIVHGYGDVTAEFFFVLESPTPAADASGDPLHGQLCDILDRLGFLQTGEDPPRLENAFITHLTRCRHTARGPHDREIRTCDPFLTAELRSINPEIIVPIGERVLRVIAEEHTTTDPSSLDIRAVHAEPLRGRGFELVPMIELDSLTDEHVEDFVATMSETLGRDYRQTKGRQGR